MPLVQRAVSKVTVTSSSWDGEFQSWSFSAYFILKVPLDLNLDPSVVSHISQDHKIGGWGLFNNQREKGAVFAKENIFFSQHIKKKKKWMSYGAGKFLELTGREPVVRGISFIVHLSVYHSFAFADYGLTPTGGTENLSPGSRMALLWSMQMLPLFFFCLQTVSFFICPLFRVSALAPLTFWTK